MKTRNILALALCAAALLLAGSCTRRPLDIEANGIRIVLHNDWTMPYERVGDDPYHFGVMMYDEPSHELAYEDFCGQQGGLIRSVPGQYACYVYDLDNAVLGFDGTEKLETLRAFSTPASTADTELYHLCRRSEGLVVTPTKGEDDDPLILEPDPVYAGLLSSLRVPVLTVVDPEFVFDVDTRFALSQGRLTIVGVTHTEYIASVQVFINNLASSRYLSTGEKLGPAVAQSFLLSEVSDEQMRGTFVYFGKLDDEDLKNTAYVVINDTGGGRYLFVFDVTEQIAAQADNADLVLELPFEVPSPAVGGAGFQPEVNDWDVIFHTVPLGLGDVDGSSEMDTPRSGSLVGSEADAVATKSAPVTSPAAFRAWGWYWPDSGSQGTPTWFVNRTFSYDGSAWSCEEGAFGLLPGNYLSRIWALAPASATGVSDLPTSSTTGAPGFYYRVPSSVSEQSDLLTAYSDVASGMSSIYSLTFNHILAGVQFWTATDDVPSCVVKSITLSGVNRSGVFSEGLGWSELSGSATYGISPNQTLSPSSTNIRIGTDAMTMMLLPQTTPAGTTLTVVVDFGDGDVTYTVPFAGVTLSQGCLTAVRLLIAEPAPEPDNTFAGLHIAPGPLTYTTAGGYAIADGWNHHSYGSIKGKNDGSYYFDFIDMGRLFEKAEFSMDDGDIENLLNPLDGWRLPTETELESILGTQVGGIYSFSRAGSTVNGEAGKHWALVQLEGVSYAGTSTPNGLLIFPDGKTITGRALDEMDNTTQTTGMTNAELDAYLAQGCAFLPADGYYYYGWYYGGEYGDYWSSEVSMQDDAYMVRFSHFELNPAESNYRWDYFICVRLVR